MTKTSLTLLERNQKLISCTSFLQLGFLGDIYLWEKSDYVVLRQVDSVRENMYFHYQSPL